MTQKMHKKVTPLRQQEGNQNRRKMTAERRQEKSGQNYLLFHLKHVTISCRYFHSIFGLLYAHHWMV